MTDLKKIMEPRRPLKQAAAFNSPTNIHSSRVTSIKPQKFSDLKAVFDTSQSSASNQNGRQKNGSEKSQNLGISKPVTTGMCYKKKEKTEIQQSYDSGDGVEAVGKNDVDEMCLAIGKFFPESASTAYKARLETKTTYADRGGKLGVESSQNFLRQNLSANLAILRTRPSIGSRSESVGSNSDVQDKSDWKDDFSANKSKSKLPDRNERLGNSTSITQESLEIGQGLSLNKSITEKFLQLDRQTNRISSSSDSTDSCRSPRRDDYSATRMDLLRRSSSGSSDSIGSPRHTESKSTAPSFTDSKDKFERSKLSTGRKKDLGLAFHKKKENIDDKNDSSVTKTMPLQFRRSSEGSILKSKCVGNKDHQSELGADGALPSSYRRNITHIHPRHKTEVVSRSAFFIRQLTQEPRGGQDSFNSDIKRQQFASRKMSTDQFDKIKCSFEQFDGEARQRFPTPKSNVEIPLTSQIFDRKKSLEYKSSWKKPAAAQPLAIAAKSMSIGNVSEFVKTINKKYPDSMDKPKSVKKAVGQEGNRGHDCQIETESSDAEYDGVLEVVDLETGNEADEESGSDEEGIYQCIDGIRSPNRLSCQISRRNAEKRKWAHHSTVMHENDSLQQDNKQLGTDGGSDSSNSDIYQPLEEVEDIRLPPTDNSSPPPLPVKAKPQNDKVKSFGAKLKQLKGKLTVTDSALRVLTAPAKAMKKKLSRTNETVLCGSDSEGSIRSEDWDSSTAQDSLYSESSDVSHILSLQTQPQLPPPLPPRQPSLSLPSQYEPDDNKSPPLPPRLHLPDSLSLNTVVPIAIRVSPDASRSTGDLRQKGQCIPNGESSRQMKQSISSSVGNLTIDSEKSSDMLAVPPMPCRQRQTSTDGYVSHDPDLEVVMREKDRSKSFESPYIDLNKSPLPIPFGQLIKYQGAFDDDGLYADLEEDELYGTIDHRYTTTFDSEPLYQVYTQNTISRASCTQSFVSSSDEELDKKETEGLYEDLNDLMKETEVTNLEKSKDKKISTLELFGKSGAIFRALWSEMSEVKESGILDTISTQERKIQEAMFEIITSEASYLKSLNILINVFLMSPEFSSQLSDRCVVTQQEQHVLFSNIGAVRESSEKFLSDLEARWQTNIHLSDICDIIYQHSMKNFECYVRYCSNQVFQGRAVSTLMKKTEFVDALHRLERSSDCQGLPMISFLLLPMQRITRLPLLVDAISHRLEPGIDRHKSASMALSAIHKVVRRCNDAAKRMEQTEQMCLLAQKMEFKVKEFPIISATRYLVKQGELTRVVNDNNTRLPFGKSRPGKQSIYFFLFCDILLCCKKKGNQQYTVTDYAQRNSIDVEMIDNAEKSKHLPLGLPSGCKNLFLLVMLENHDRKQVEMVLSCNSQSDRTRWIDALVLINKINDNEKIYEEWDCPQVQCVKKYLAKEEDELSLEESDVVNVFKKMADGWYEGERICDGVRGWFPSEYTAEILNSHVRARNLRLQYRLQLAGRTGSSQA